MRGMLAAVGVVAVGAAWAASAWAGPGAGQGPAAGMDPRYIQEQKDADRLGPDPDLETQNYDRLLTLSAEQRAKVRALLERQRALFKKSYAQRTRFQNEVMALQRRILALNKRFDAEGNAFNASRADLMKDLRDLLTPSQRRTFDVMQAERQRAEEDWKRRKEAEDVKRLGGDGVQGRFGEQDAGSGGQ